MSTLADLFLSCAGLGNQTAEYKAKQVHKVPSAPTIDREKFIVGKVAGKTVLDIGASGVLHQMIIGAAKRCYGIDREDGVDVVGLNLDDVTKPLPSFPEVELVVCGEVIEHLANPGWFLERLNKTYPSIPLLITVPNAFCEVGMKVMKQGIENVNLDHVAWYSWMTVKTLLGRYGYSIKEFYWYKGKPRLSEGLIVTT